MSIKVYTRDEAKQKLQGKTCFYGYADSFLGLITIAHIDNYICWISFDKDSTDLEQDFSFCRFKRDDLFVCKTTYSIFNNKNYKLPIIMIGTDFQIAVWKELYKNVHKGSIISYGQLARNAGFEGASRAVGTAMHKNRIAIVVPCHRVISGDGRIGGYGGGLEIKKKLLQHENSLHLIRNLL